MFADVLEHYCIQTSFRRIPFLKTEAALLLIPNIGHNAINVLRNGHFNYQEIGLLDNNIPFYTLVALMNYLQKIIFTA